MPNAPEPTVTVADTVLVVVSIFTALEWSSTHQIALPTATPMNGVFIATLPVCAPEAVVTEFDEALATLQRATTLSPRTVTAWHNLAAVLAARGDRAAARAALDRALALSPEDPRLRAQWEALSSAGATPPPTAQRSPTTLPR